MHGHAVPKGLDKKDAEKLGAVYKQLTASFGAFAMNTLVASTKALKSGTAANDSHYTDVENQIASLTSQRDALMAQIRTGLNNAQFNGDKLDKKDVKKWTKAAQDLIAQSAALAASS
jgi:hypothetical protein